MSAAELLALTRCDGVTITTTANGDLQVFGLPEVVEWWAPKVRAAKADIVELLRRLQINARGEKP